MTINKKIRLRFAPSPTGGLHMGGVRTALFSYLYAKKHNGDFILRIEDTDQTRYVPGAEEYIIESLKWCGIEPNEGVGFGDGPHAPYRQSERKDKGIYTKYVEQLINCGGAYYAFDTEEEIEAMRKKLEAAKVVSPQYNAITRESMRNSLSLSQDEVQKLLNQKTPFVVRLKVPRNEDIRFHDLIRGWITVSSKQIDDKVLLKSDGMPTYHLAHVVDDIEMEISHVVRGEEWLPSAPAHILIYKYLGLENTMPYLAHLPLILKPDGNGKLSKRDKSGLPMFPLNWHDVRTNEKYIGYKETGYIKDAFINMLALLGWNPGNNQEILSKQELITQFSFEKVNKSGAKFDPEKTKWFNQQYLKQYSDEQLAELVTPLLKEKSINKPTEFIIEFCKLIKEKAHFINEFYDLGIYFFEAPTQYAEAVILKKWNSDLKPLYTELTDKLNTLTQWNLQSIHDVFNDFTTQGKKIDMQLVRVLTTGLAGGAQLLDFLALLGKDEIIKRLKAGIQAQK